MSLNFKEEGSKFYDNIRKKEQEEQEKRREQIEKYKAENRYKQQQETNKIIALSGMILAFIGGINLLVLIKDKVVIDEGMTTILISIGVILTLCTLGGLFVLVILFLRTWDKRGE